MWWIRRRAIYALSYVAAAVAPIYQAHGQDKAPSSPIVNLPQRKSKSDQQIKNNVDIIVVGRRSRLQLESPTSTISTQQLRQFGVQTVGDVADRLRTQLTGATASSNGQIITLLNGRRISGQAAIADIPVGAILRVDVLPSTAAETYGYQSPQQIVNIVLKKAYKSHDLLISNISAKQTRTDELKGSYNQFTLLGNDRLSASLEYQIRRPFIDRIDFIENTGYVSHRSSLNTSINGATNQGAVLLTSSISFGRDKDILPSQCFDCHDITSPLKQHRNRFSLTAGADAESTDWTLHTGLVVNVDNTSRDGVAVDRHTYSKYEQLETVITGAVHGVLSNDIILTGKSNLRSASLSSIVTNDISSSISSFLHTETLTASTALFANKGSFPKLYGHVGVGAISSSKSRNFFNSNIGLSLRISPRASIEVRYTMERTPPTVSQVGDPVIVRTGYPIIDLRNSLETPVLLISGGNPSLDPEQRKNISLLAAGIISSRRQIGISISLSKETTRGIIALPNLVTSLLEGQFSNRFLRNPNGELISVDGRYLNLPSASVWASSAILSAPIIRSEEPSATRLDATLEIKSFFNAAGSQINQDYRPLDSSLRLTGGKGRFGTNLQIDYSFPYALKDNSQLVSFSPSATTALSVFFDPRITNEASRVPRLEMSVLNLFNRYRVLENGASQLKNASRRIAQVGLPLSIRLEARIPF